MARPVAIGCLIPHSRQITSPNIFPMIPVMMIAATVIVTIPPSSSEIPIPIAVVMKSLREKKQAAKLEFLDSDIFQVFSRYVEIDGKPYVMEMLKKLDEDTLIDAVGYGKMVQKLSVYNDKLYRDALTGAYNRSKFTYSNPCKNDEHPGTDRS